MTKSEPPKSRRACETRAGGNNRGARKYNAARATIGVWVSPIQTAASVQNRIEELVGRVQTVERRAGELQREPAHEAIQADELLQRLERIESRLSELARDTGSKLGEVGAVRERLTRIENRVLETSKEQIARAGESTGLRDRLARLEARLSDLSREQVARAVEAAGLRERVFRLEQRTIAIDNTPTRMVAERRRGGKYEACRRQ